MPAMITHYLLGRRMIPLSGLPPIRRQDAFLLGTQGPDILYFFRAYPWLAGKAGLPVGNALHEVCPSQLFTTIRFILSEATADEKKILESYVLGFICHYAADRRLHPFVCHFQEELQQRDPTYAKSSEPYHYRMESALDAELLRHDRGEYVTAFSLVTVVPKRDRMLEAAVAKFYHRLIKEMLGEEIPESKLRHLVGDMRLSMRLMTDRTELKGKAIRFWERTRKSGAVLSSLLRTKEIDNYDYANTEHRLWIKHDDVVSRQDFFEICDEVVEDATVLMNEFVQGIGGVDLTDEIDFAGRHYGEGSATIETDREL